MNGAGEFAAAAVRLAGFAGVVLGWRPGEFWAATPAELSAVVKALRGDEEGLGGDDVERLKRMLADAAQIAPPASPPLNRSAEIADG